MSINNSKNNASIMSTPSSSSSALLEQIGVIVDHVPGGSVHRGFKEKQRGILSYSTASETRACHLRHSNQDSTTDREKKRKEERDRQTESSREGESERYIEIGG